MKRNKAALLFALMLTAPCLAQTREYKIVPLDPAEASTMSGTETLTISDSGRKWQSVIQWQRKGMSHEELLQEFEADGSNKRLVMTLWREQGTIKETTTFRNGKPHKGETETSKGKKESELFGSEDDGVTSSTAICLDFSVVCFQLALNRAQKSKFPVTAGTAMIPLGAMAGLIRERIEKTGEPGIVPVGGKPRRVQQYIFTELADSDENQSPPSPVWADADSGEILAMRMAGILSIVQKGFDPSVLANWKVAQKPAPPKKQ